jgi:hypothetical protein
MHGTYARAGPTGDESERDKTRDDKFAKHKFPPASGSCRYRAMHHSMAQVTRPASVPRRRDDRWHLQPRPASANAQRSAAGWVSSEMHSTAGWSIAGRSWQWHRRSSRYGGMRTSEWAQTRGASARVCGLQRSERCSRSILYGEVRGTRTQLLAPGTPCRSARSPGSSCPGAHLVCRSGARKRSSPSAIAGVLPSDRARSGPTDPARWLSARASRATVWR